MNFLLKIVNVFNLKIQIFIMSSYKKNGVR